MSVAWKKLEVELVPCRCALPSHEQPTCPNGAAIAAQGSLYLGLYDSRSGAPPIRRVHHRVGLAPPLRQVKLLNPDYDDDDAAGRRFAQLEID
jgi:hypothetical protein